MSIEYDEKGKFFTEVVSKTPVNAVIRTTAQLVRGQVHVRQGERLKDELDRDEKFLAVTDAVILTEDGQTEFQTPFLAIQRRQIIWIFPEEEEPKG